MIDGSEVGSRSADEVDELFLDRWSPRAMSGEAVTEEELMSLFEAARWAPSSFNNQPWRILYARRDTEHWPTFLGLLVEGNQRLGEGRGGAPALRLEGDLRPQRRAVPDALLRHRRGVGEPRASGDAPRPRHARHAGLRLRARAGRVEHPEGFRVEAMAAVGRPGDPSSCPRRCAPERSRATASRSQR